METLLTQALRDVHTGQVTVETVRALKRCVYLSQLASDCHITQLPADVHMCIALHLLHGFSAQKLALNALTLRTFCSKNTMAEMWRSCCSLAPCAVGPFLRGLRKQVSHVIEKSGTLLVANRYEGYVVLMTPEQPAPTDLHTGIHTDEGRTVVFQRNRDDEHGRMLVNYLDLTRVHSGQHMTLSSHRCMLKRDAKIRFNTYCPYDQQDFISIETGAGRQQMHVIDSSAHGYAIHLKVR